MPDDAPAPAPSADPGRPGRVPGPGSATDVGLVVAGLALGVLGAVLTASHVTVRGVTLPWGLVLSLAAVLACVRGGSWLVGSRRGGALVGLGWVLPTLAFATVNPGGDVLLPDEARTYVYLVGATVLVVLAVALPLPRGAREVADAARARRRPLPPDPL